MADLELWFDNRQAWRAWLAENHARPVGLWLRIAKKGALRPSVRYEEAVKEALCFGWIDSRVQKVDAESYRQWFSPRKTKSVWSALNKRYLQELEAEGLIEEPGRQAIEVGKANGSWDRLLASEALVVPPDFAEALHAAGGTLNWEAFPPRVKQNTLFWITDTKNPETRARRTAKAAEAAGKNERLF